MTPSNSFNMLGYGIAHQSRPFLLKLFESLVSFLLADFVFLPAVSVDFTLSALDWSWRGLLDFSPTPFSLTKSLSLLASTYLLFKRVFGIVPCFSKSAFQAFFLFRKFLLLNYGSDVPTYVLHRKV